MVRMKGLPLWLSLWLSLFSLSLSLLTQSRSQSLFSSLAWSLYLSVLSGTQVVASEASEATSTRHGTHSADYFTLLSVPRSASALDLKRAYYSQSRLLHPDKNSSPTASSAFIALRAAYETLSDPVSRRQYEASLASSSTSFGATILSWRRRGYTLDLHVDMNWVQQATVKIAKWTAITVAAILAAKYAGMYQLPQMLIQGVTSGLQSLGQQLGLF